MTRRLLLGLVVATPLLAFGAYAGWSAFQVRADLTDARADAEQLRSALVDGDQPEAERALTRLEEHSSSARERTAGPTWGVLGELPWAGDDADGVRLVADVIADLTADGLAPLVATSESLDAGTFAPRNGRLSVEAIETTREPVNRAAAAFDAADERLAGVDPAGFTDSLADVWTDLRGKVSDARGSLDSARTAVDLLPGMLGSEQPRDYLLVFLNNAEPRALGGMPGSLAELHVEDGRLELGRQRAASAFPELAQPVLPLSKDEKRNFHQELGTFVQDAGFTPHFPRAAELLAARWEREYGTGVDAVLAVDPVALSYLLEATGPVQVGGVRLTAGNAVDELLNEVYLRLEDPAAQDAWFEAVAREVFAKLTDGSGDPQELVRGLARGAVERRVFVHSFRAEEQAAIEGTRVAGELSGEGDAPQVGVFLNDATASKMGYYLDYDVDVESVGCQDGRQTLEATMTIGSHLAPGTKLPVAVTGPGTYGVSRGDHLVVAELFGPFEGTLTHFTFDGDKQGGAESSYLGHPSLPVATFLKPGQDFELTWRMTTGPDQAGDVEVLVGAGVARENESSVATSGC